MQKGIFRWAFIAAMVLLFIVPQLFAQSTSSSTSVSGTVNDPSNAVISGATVEIHNPVSGYDRTTRTDSAGAFSFPNVPFNPYHLTVTANGFASFVQDVDVRSSMPVTLKVGLQIAGAS